MLGEGRSLYHISRMILESGKTFGDGSNIIYVNGAYENDADPVGRLMHDFRCRRADEMLHPVLSERVHYLKENEGGRETMCQAIEELNERTAQRTAKLERERITLKLLELGILSDEKIAEISNLTIEEVKALKSQRSA